MAEAPPTLKVQTGVKANKTLLSVCDTQAGVYTGIGGLCGDIQLPERERKNEKFQANDADAPYLVPGDLEYSAVELTIAYSDYATYTAVEGLDNGVGRYFKFALANGNWFTYFGMIAKLGAVAGAEQGACVGKMSIDFSDKVDSAAAAAPPA